MEAQKIFVMDKEIRVYRQKGHKEPPHLHGFMEFVYITSGKEVHIVDGIEYAVSKGDLIIINYNQTHSFQSDETAEHYNILIKPEFVDAQIKNREDIFALLEVSGFEDFRNLIDRSKSTIRFSVEERSRFESILLFLEKELLNQDAGHRITTRSCISLMLTMIFRKLSTFSPVFKSTIDNELLRYIRENCSEKLTLETLAEKGHYNPSYFSRAFKEHTGVTFTQYIKQARMNLACELLSDTDTRIDDIYPRVGYSDKTKFFKDFKEHTGTTPLHYRKK